MYLHLLLSCLPLLFPITTLAQAADSERSKIELPTELIHQFRPITWVENLAVRRNGWILPITTTSPLLRQLDPASGTLKLVYDFAAYGNAIQGITAITSDVFAVDVLTCNVTTLACTPGSVTTWLVRFCDQSSDSGQKDDAVSVRKVGAFPKAGFLNGMAALNDAIVLIADSFLGGIWSLNVYTKQQKLLFTDYSMNGTATIATGINGIRVRPGWVYFTNSAKGTFNRVPIDSNTGEKAGKAETITNGLSGPDDFEIDDEAQEAYVCNGAVNEIIQITLNGGRWRSVAQIPGPTSVRWNIDRAGSSSKSLYASDVGGLTQYIEGNVTVGGAIYRIGI